VINRILGATQAGYYAPILQLVAGFRGMGGVIGSLFAPTLMSLHVKGGPSAANAYLLRSLRFFGILMAVPIGVVCGLSEDLLRVWLGSSNQTNPMLVVIMVGSLSVTLFEHPLSQVQLAANRVKIPALATLTAGAVNALLAVQLCRIAGVSGVAIAGVLVLCAKTLLFTPAYNSRILKTTSFSQLKAIGTSVTVSLVAFTWSSLLAKLVAPSSVITLAAAAACSAALSYLSLYPFVLNSDERLVVDRTITRFRGLVFRTAAP
jgi:membrane protein EpsK